MEIKEMVERARKAQVIYDERFDQERVDQVIKAAARTIFDHAEELAHQYVLYLMKLAPF